MSFPLIFPLKFYFTTSHLAWLRHLAHLSMAHRLTRSRVYVPHLNPLKLIFIILNLFLFKYICLTWSLPELRRSPNVIRPIRSIVECWVKPKGLFFNLTSLICLCSNVFHSSQSAFNQASLGFNGFGPVRFLAQYSVQTLIRSRSRSRSTSVTVRFGLNFGLQFSNLKQFQISKTSFECQKFFQKTYPLII